MKRELEYHRFDDGDGDRAAVVIKRQTHGDENFAVGGDFWTASNGMTLQSLVAPTECHSDLVYVRGSEHRLDLSAIRGTTAYIDRVCAAFDEYVATNGEEVPLKRPETWSVECKATKHEPCILCDCPCDPAWPCCAECGAPQRPDLVTIANWLHDFGMNCLSVHHRAWAEFLRRMSDKNSENSV